MAKILILFAHPLLERSRIHVELLRQASTVKQVTINDLYEHYPEFDIDVAREKQLAEDHNIIIWQHPLYWYNAPAMLKQWQDLVLEHGWAYGKDGTALSGKKIFNVITSGGGESSYLPGGFNKYSIHDFMRPFERTAILCRMNYWPPFWVPGAHLLELPAIKKYGEQYKTLLESLSNEVFSEEEISRRAFLNEMVPMNTIG